MTKTPPLTINADTHADPATQLLREGRRSALIGWSLTLLFLTLLGALLRLFQLDSQPLWLDELYTAELVQGGAATIWHNSFIDIMPPLANILFWVSAQIFGLSAWSLRFVSSLAAILALPVYGMAAARATDRGTAALATTLLAVAPLAVYYAQEARPYALPMLMLCVTFLAYERLRRRGTALNWLLFVAASILAIQTQYVNAILVAAQFAGLLIVSEGRRREVVIGGAITGLLMAASIYPFLSGGLHVAGNWGDSSTIRVGPTTILLLTGDQRLAMPLLTQIILITVGIGAAGALFNWRRWEGLMPHFLQIAVFVFVVFIMLPLIGKAAPAHDARIVLLLLPSALLCISSGILALGRLRFGWVAATIVAGALITASFMSVVRIYTSLEKSPEAHDAALIAAQAKGEPVVSDGSAYSLTAALRFYWPEVPTYRIRQTPDANGVISVIPDPSPLLGQTVPATGVGLQAIEQQRRFWLVFRGEEARPDLADMLKLYKVRATIDGKIFHAKLFERL